MILCVLDRYKSKLVKTYSLRCKVWGYGFIFEIRAIGSRVLILGLKLGFTTLKLGIRVFVSN